MPPRRLETRHPSGGKLRYNFATAEMTASSVLPPLRPKERLHLAHVEGLRAAAALTVYVNHAYAQSWSPAQDQYPKGALRLLTYSLVTGHLAVSVFIVISGFCLALPVVAASDYLRGGVREFMKRRARRILPPYYAALALSLALIATIIGDKTGSVWDVPILVTWQGVVSHLLLLQDLFGTGSINYVLWSIAVEWQLYFLFPLLVWALRRYGVWLTVLAALLIGYAVRFGFDHTRVERANPHYLGLFALGMLGAYIAQSERPEFQKARQLDIWRWAALLALIAVVALCGYWGVPEARRRFHELDILVGIMALGSLVHSSRRDTNALHRVLSWKPIVLIGTFSYSLYLLHAPLLQVLWKFTLRPLGLPGTTMFALLMTLGLVLILAFSYGFFRIFEAPFLRKSGRLSPALRDVAPIPHALEPERAVPAQERRGA
jgi:peptidoglycan/LPS O-acetylase OafA/YrhL